MLHSPQTPPLEAFPDISMPDEAWPLYKHSDKESKYNVRMSDLYQKVHYIGMLHTSILLYGPPDQLKTHEVYW